MSSAEMGNAHHFNIKEFQMKNRGYFSKKGYIEKVPNPKKITTTSLLKLQRAILSEIEKNDNVKKESYHSSKEKYCGSLVLTKKLLKEKSK